MDDWTTATALLRCSTRLIDGIQAGVAERGFPDVRPAHGFAFAFLSRGPASASELAAHLSVTKQAAAQLVDQLERGGYVVRRASPVDGRVWLLHLTARGRRCTEAAEAAAADVVAQWRSQLPARDYRQFADSLARVAGTGSLRPSW